ncbi:M15 family metallopeptidase domain-containing protein [Maridesulfovibrio frigidus]|uniref:hypothetical protein n=1 Tax=Maridesulfovibrio frigidus TaxID=340956 RepID=UPI0004E166C9|nr:hypothetical protein [Maridesulfovibrio frigidus]
MKKDKIMFIQELLNKNGANLVVDGIAGQATLAEIKAIPQIPDNWTDEKCLIGYIQVMAKAKNLLSGIIDGGWNIGTTSAYAVLRSRNGQRDEVSISTWPNQSANELLNYYGPVGENQVRLHLPYPHKLAWDKGTIVNSYLCHEKVHDSLERVLTQTFSHYGQGRIEELRLNLWGGCLNVRPMRAGKRTSTHSWGIAVDYDPDNNKFRWDSDKATFAKPEYDAWWSFWEAEGWTSLGRAKNKDWMHIQAANF